MVGVILSVIFVGLVFVFTFSAIVFGLFKDESDTVGTISALVVFVSFVSLCLFVVCVPMVALLMWVF
jgi:hypothetical protein